MEKIEPVAWRKLLETEDGDALWKFMCFPVLKDGEPLYPQSTIDALQAEVGRLTKVMKAAAR